MQIEKHYWCNRDGDMERCADPLYSVRAMHTEEWSERSVMRMCWCRCRCFEDITIAYIYLFSVLIAVHFFHLVSPVFFALCWQVILLLLLLLLLDALLLPLLLLLLLLITVMMPIFLSYHFFIFIFLCIQFSDLMLYFRVCVCRFLCFRTDFCVHAVWA